jgi:hypothetical protein
MPMLGAINPLASSSGSSGRRSPECLYCVAIHERLFVAGAMMPTVAFVHHQF